MDARERLIIQSFQDLSRQTPAPWIVRDVLRDNSILLLYGQRGSYKSFYALDLACSIATNTPFLGQEVRQAGMVIYIAAEGSGGMVQRVRAWKQSHPEIQREIPVYFVTEPAVITAESDDMELLIERIRVLIDWQEAGWMDEEAGHIFDQESAREFPLLIVIDTLARCFIGDENEQEDMGCFIQGVDRLRAEFHTSVLVVHHSGRDASHERGSTVLPGAADTIFKITDQGAGEIRVQCEKMKDSGEPPDHTVFYHQVTLPSTPRDTDNEVLTSVVLTATSGQIVRKTRFIDIMESDEYPTTKAKIVALIESGVSGNKKAAQRRIDRYKRENDL